MSLKINPITGKFDTVRSLASLDTRYLQLSGSIASITIRDHHLLTGLTDDDHSQYPLLIGRAGGQTLKGGTAITDILKLQGTSGNGTLTSAAIQALVGNNGATVAMTILNNGNVGIGTTAPTARLHLPACTAIANTASLKIDAGILAIIPVSGNIESDGIHLYWTDSVMGIRHQLDNQI